jgi:hypothetical protein
MRILAASTLSALLGLFSFGVRAAGLPLVISATVDYSHNTLTINGQNFGSAPAVNLDALAFATLCSGSGQIVSSNRPNDGTWMCRLGRRRMSGWPQGYTFAPGVIIALI